MILSDLPFTAFHKSDQLPQKPLMDSSSLFLLYFLPFIFFVTLPPTFSVALPLESSDKVSVAVYNESLCPDSADFIINDLVKIFDDRLIDIVFRLSPWGNAKIGHNHSFICQHGPMECLLNTVEACAIHAWPDLSEYFPFLYCVESLIYNHKQTEWETCFDKVNLDSKPVIDCFQSGYGEQLELKYAAEIKALQPPHTYVPWVTVDGQPIYDDYRIFLTYVCKAYKGTTPEACSKYLSLNHVPTRKERANPNHPVCYKEETSKSSLSKIPSTINSWMHGLDMEASI